MEKMIKEYDYESFEVLIKDLKHAMYKSLQISSENHKPFFAEKLFVTKVDVNRLEEGISLLHRASNSFLVYKDDDSILESLISSGARQSGWR